MLTFVDVAGLGIEIRKWVGIWMEILVEEEGITEGWVLQHKEGGLEEYQIHGRGFLAGVEEGTFGRSRADT